MTQPVFRAENISFKIFEKAIIDSISFEVFAGDYISIIGPNGAGKTSLLKCLMRIYPVSEGKMFFRGTPLARFSQKQLAKEISYVPQSDGRFFPFTVEEFVLMGRYPHLSPFTSYSKKDIKAVNSALELTGTSQLAERQLMTLSGGERQTVFIAAALAQNANILLLDEPTTFLDPKHEDNIYRILQTINKELGITIISVTHDINNAILQSGKVIALKEGIVHFSGTPEKLFKKQVLEKIYDKKFIYISHPLTGQKIIAPEIPGA